MTKLTTEIKKIMEIKKNLFLVLLETLEEEKEILKSSDLDALWKLNHRKNDIASDIENARKDLIELLHRYGKINNLDEKKFSLEEFLNLFIDSEEYDDVSEMCQDLSLVKSKVYETQKVNKMFVEEYLGILEELVTVITGSGNNKTYSRQSIGPARSSGMLLSQEV
jgi:hypothetical protein